MLSIGSLETPGRGKQHASCTTSEEPEKPTDDFAAKSDYVSSFQKCTKSSLGIVKKYHPYVQAKAGKGRRQEREETGCKHFCAEEPSIPKIEGLPHIWGLLGLQFQMISFSCSKNASVYMLSKRRNR